MEAIIFDFGNIFIDLDFEKQAMAMAAHGIDVQSEFFIESLKKYELGKIDEFDFFSLLQEQAHNSELEDLREAFNSIILEFPLERLEFLEKLKNQYKLYLLSNTNQTHIDKFEHRVGLTFAREFYACFDKIYFSFENKFLKPSEESFQKIIVPNGLKPNQTIYVDDLSANIETAKKLGLVTWHLDPKSENITQLFTKILI